MEICKFVRKVTSALFSPLQLGNWVFHAHGTGMMPGPMDPINIYSELGGNSSVIIPFRNPTERQVVIDVIMKERLLSRSGEIFIVTFVTFNNAIILQNRGE